MTFLENFANLLNERSLKVPSKIIKLIELVFN